MMKHHLRTLTAAFVLSLFFTPLTAQKIVWGEDNDIPKSFQGVQYIGEKSNVHHLVRAKVSPGVFEERREPVLEYIDRDMFLQRRSSTISMEKGHNYLTVIPFQKEFYLVTTAWNKDKKIRSIHMQPIDLRVSTLKGRSKRIATMTVPERETPVYVNYKYSPDKKKLGIAVSAGDQKSKRAVKYKIYVLNSIGRRDWAKSGRIKVPFPNQRFENFALNNEGDVFVLLTNNGQYALATDADGKSVGDDMTAIAYTYEGDSIKQISPQLDDGQSFMEGFITTTGARGFAVSGLFREDKEAVSGFFSFRFDRSSKLLEETSVPMAYMLPKEAIEAEEGDDKKWDGLNRVLSTPEGGHYLMTEIYLGPMTHMGEVPDKKSKDNPTQYHDILINFIGPDGQHEWSKVIPKIQQTDGSKGSFQASLHETNLVLAFNDDIANSGVEDHEKITPFLGKRSKMATNDIIRMLELNSSGVLTEKILSGTGDELLIYADVMDGYIGYRTMLYSGNPQERNFRLGYIKYEE